MTPDEIDHAVLEGLILDHEGHQVDDPRFINGTLVIDNFAVLPIAKISSGVSQETDIEVVDQYGEAFGTICFTKNLGAVARSELTLWQFIAYLADANMPEIVQQQYIFKTDYLILDASRLTDYLENYSKSSAIWGRFSHSAVGSLEHVSVVDKIIAIPGIEISSPHHSEAINRYLNANNPFERFLRIYHSIELLFDYVVVKKIKALDDGIFGFSQLLNEYGKSELDRLKAITIEFCANPVSISRLLEKSSNFPDVRYDIFFLHSKSTNPYSDAGKWQSLIDCVDGACFNEDALRSHKLLNNNTTFHKVTLELAAYWIYRIRCSIAHNRVGEFLLKDEHAAFVGEFAEPLMIEVAKQIFANPSFKTL